MTLINDPCLSADERRLRDRISEVSEACYKAGWMHDAEFEVWRLATEGGAWGDSKATDLALQLTDAMALAANLGRWIVWNGLAECDHQPIDLADWERRYGAWRVAQP